MFLSKLKFLFPNKNPFNTFQNIQLRFFSEEVKLKPKKIKFNKSGNNQFDSPENLSTALQTQDQKAQEPLKKDTKPAFQSKLKEDDGKVRQEFIEKVNQKMLSPTNFSLATLMQGETKRKMEKYKKMEKIYLTDSRFQQRITKKELDKTYLPKDKIIREFPKNIFRLNLTVDDMKHHTPLVNQAMSLNNASIGELRKARILEIRKLFGRHERDTANPTITACVYCEDIIHLMNHLKENRQDVSAVLALRDGLIRRRKFLRYLKRTDANGYAYVVKYYGIKDIDDAMAKTHKMMLMPKMAK